MLDLAVFVILVGAVSSVVGAIAATITERARTKEIRQKAGKALNQVKALEDRLEAWDAALGRKEAMIALIAKERDQFARMAESHEVKYPSRQSTKRENVQLWKDRSFLGHPSANLKHLHQELHEHLDNEVILSVVIQPTQLGETGFTKANAQARSGDWLRGGQLGPFEFHGTGRRALSDLRTYLTDPNRGFVRPAPKKRKRVALIDALSGKMQEEGQEVLDDALAWVDADSPLPMLVTLEYVKHIEPQLPTVHTVEVAVVRTEVQVIEKPVHAKTPEDTEGTCGHSREEIVTLVNDTLARRIAELEVEKADQALSRVAAKASRQQKTTM